MAPSSADDELLSILLVNLRNAAATFGEGSPPHETIRTTIEDHLQAMKAKGFGTNIAAFRSDQRAASDNDLVAQTSAMFSNLAIRAKPS